jgi:hypothetical protein
LLGCRFPREWTGGDRRLATLAIVIGLAIIITVVCGYVFEWKWTGLIKPKQRTFWDWLSLLIVPFVLALGGYLFTRSESRRTHKFADQQRALDREIADQQRTLDREIADQRRQDDMLQACLDGMSDFLTDKDRPLHRAQQGGSLSTVARARTLTVLRRLDGERKRSLLQCDAQTLKRGFSRRAFLRSAALISSSVFLLGTHTAPMCVRWGDSRTFNLLGSYTFNHLSRSC